MSKTHEAWERFVEQERRRVQNETGPSLSEQRHDRQNGILLLPSFGCSSNKGQNVVLSKEDDPKVIVMENKEGTYGSQGCCPGPGARRIIIMIIIYAIVVTAIGSFLAKLSFGLPSLNKQIAALNKVKAELQNQITDLTVQVDELTYQVDRLDNGTQYLSKLNDSLNQTVKDLNKTVSAYSDENNRLNASNIVFQEENRKLNVTVAQNEVLILNLNQEIGQLNTNITSLNVTMNQLDSTLKIANNTILNLNSALLTQQNSNQQLQNATISLNSQLDDTKATVAQLSSINDDLSRIINYLNSTGTFGMSFDALRSELATQILRNQVLLYNDIHTYYDDKLSNIPCNFKSAFATRTWMSNTSKPIGSTDYLTAKNYLNGFYFSPVCASMADFEKLLILDPSFGYDGTNVTVNVLNSAMNIYFGQLLLYYFPFTGYTGPALTLNDWIAANFTCVSFPASKKFVYK